MSSNLPPGCSSADGGIDHALESCLDSLCEAIQTPSEATYLEMMLPMVRRLIETEYKFGLEEGKLIEWEASQRRQREMLRP